MRALLAVSLVGLLACHDPEPIDASDVIQLAVCPDDAPCDEVADGESLLSVDVCVPPEAGSLVDDLAATIRISRGTFLGEGASEDGRTYTADVLRSGCIRAQFRAGTRPGTVHVDAELAGYPASAKVQLAAAPLDEIVTAASPGALEPGERGDVQITAEVLAVRGEPSEGTRVSFGVVEVAPPGSVAYLSPISAAVVEGRAETRLVTSASVTSVELELTARPPRVEGLEDPDPISVPLVIGRFEDEPAAED